ncbi:DEAD/DEAH box helicase [Candidatus Woesearchaeota archaeon]|nr:DEAD/DEAH box helicase [Candidatus Woesearchaeota archaeon]
MAFKALGITEALAKAIAELNFEAPTEIQQKSIPPVVAGHDVIAGSKTGSGKTLAFTAGIMQKVVPGQGLQALVMTPTRELAEQVAKSISGFSRHQRMHVVTVYGGVSINPQIDSLPHADVVVGTPGRLLDHLERNTIRLNKVRILVLDEADRMLDMGFIEDVERIIRACPQDRQTLLFSATIPPDIEHLTKKYMRNPERVSAGTQVDPSQLKQVFYTVPDNQKFSLLVHLLKQEREGLVMVFCNSRRTVDFVEKNLRKNTIEAEAIHGGLSQAKRSRTLDKFHAGKTYALICTDVAARGLDIQGVTHVYNYDIPKESKQYIHRIGRTARVDNLGKAINLLGTRDYENFDRIHRDYRLNIEKLELPVIERVRVEPYERSEGFGDRRGFRGRDDRRGGFGRGERREFRRDGPRHGGGFGHSHQSSADHSPQEHRQHEGHRAPKFGSA